GGSACGRVQSPLSGLHNVRNAVAAIAICAEGAGVSVQALSRHLGSFAGVRRRQELCAVVDGVRIYDDFAHHPTAVSDTLEGLRARDAHGRLIGVLKPRSAPASRKLHEALYVTAFDAADLPLLSPVARREIPAEERLDVEGIA